jgi:hypothetical protein
MKKIFTQFYPKTLILFTICFSFAANTYAQPGNALNFDGTNNYVVIGPAGGVYAAGSSYTKEAWVIYSGANFFDAENIISSKDPFWVNGGKLGAANNYDVLTGPPADVEDPALFPLNHWVHVAVTYDAGTATLNLYKNAVLVATKTGAVPSVSGQHYIGGYDDVGVKYIWQGNIDQVKIYNTALTQANLQADMLSTSASVPASLIGDYNFDIGTAGGTNTGLTNLPDASVAANNGTLVNFPLTGTGSNWVESYAMVLPTATSASSLANTSFSANWTAPTFGTVDNYIVDVSTTADFSAPVTGSPFTVAFGTNILSVTGLTANTTYYYRVAADKTSVTGQGARSNTITLTTLNILPVNSLSFNVSKATAANLLQWSTGAEQNTRYFEVQQSTNAKDFKTIAVVNASGNSSTVKNYQYSDNTALLQAPVYYYRLKLVDINGSFTYSDILLIKNSKGAVVTVYPNPAQDRVIVNITDKSLMNTTAQLSDMSGKVLQNVLITQTVTTLNIRQYEKGVYVLRMANGESVKLVKE